MSEKPKPRVRVTSFTGPLVDLQNKREKHREVTRSIDNSEGLADAALSVMMAKKAVSTQHPPENNS